MRTQDFSFPSTVIEAYAGIALWKAKAGITIVGVVSDTERYVIRRTMVSATDVYAEGGKLIAEAILNSPVKVARIGLRYTARLDETMELASSLSIVAPVTVMKPAKEILEEPRALLWSKFDRKIATIGVVTAREIARATISNEPVGPEDPGLFALAAEEYQRRHRKFRRQKAPKASGVVSDPARPEPRYDDIISRISEMQKQLALEVAMIERMRMGGHIQ